MEHRVSRRSPGGATSRANYHPTSFNYRSELLSLLAVGGSHDPTVVQIASEGREGGEVGRVCGSGFVPKCRGLSTSSASGLRQTRNTCTIDRPPTLPTTVPGLTGSLRDRDGYASSAVVTSNSRWTAMVVLVS